MSDLDTSALDYLFRPKSVAIVGASTDPVKIGGRPVNLCKLAGFEGRIFPVNPSADLVQGIPAYPSLDAIDQPIDCGIVAVPAPHVLETVEKYADMGVKTVEIFSAGFAEAGEEGRRTQQRITDIARAANMRVLGPNSMGCFGIPAAFYGTFVTIFFHNGGKGWLKQGPVSIASQSGGMGTFMLVLGRERGMGFSKWVATGNQADIEISDCIAYLAEDDETEIILSYMEGCRDRDRLVHALELAHRKGKPVIVYKVGESEAASHAALSHTDSLTGSDQVFDALFKQYGVYRAQSLAELVNVAAACHQGLYPDRPNVALLTGSGGGGIVMADATARAGLSLPSPPVSAQAEIVGLSALASARNPIDAAAAAMSDMSIFSGALNIILTQDAYPAVVIYLTHIPFNRDEFDALHKELKKARRAYPDRVIALAMLCPPPLRRKLERQGFLVYEDPSLAVEMVGALYRVGKALREAGLRGAPPALPRAAMPPPSAPASEAEAKRILASAGIPVVEDKLAPDAETAAAMADAFGYPVTLKIASPDITHKSEVGGVALNLADADSVRAAYQAVTASAAAAAPGARIDGVLVAPMVTGAVETILGVHIDPVMGPVVMFGMGGIFVEIYQDVSYRLAPFGTDEAHAMIQEIKGFPLLNGARGRPKMDVGALAQTLAALSVYAAAHADAIQSIDINPFLVRPAGQGGLAVDAAILPAARTPSH